MLRGASRLVRLVRQAAATGPIRAGSGHGPSLCPSEPLRPAACRADDLFPMQQWRFMAGGPRKKEKPADFEPPIRKRKAKNMKGKKPRADGDGKGAYGAATAGGGSRGKKSPPGPARKVSVTEGVSIRGLAAALNMDAADLEAFLVAMGETPQSHEDSVKRDAVELVGMEYGADIEVTKAKGRGGKKDEPRPAVITVMGHVDHGKTSLLDALRKTSVVDKEAGGITQHMGAFSVRMPRSGVEVTFIDTPGHAAFSQMRARGAAVTDIVILMVSAVDGVMPQTREAYTHASAAGCPVVVAVSMIDRPGADPSAARRSCLAEGIPLEEAGGDVQVVETAAPSGVGLDALEDALALQSEMMELRADTACDAVAVVVEARLDKGQGPVATAIVRAGALQPGGFVVAGTQWGRLRALRTPHGGAIDRAGPGMPVEVTGLRGVPAAGDEILVVPTEDRARRVSAARLERAEAERLRRLAAAEKGPVVHVPRVTQSGRARGKKRGQDEEEEEGEEEEAAPQKGELLLIIKADVRGTAEAVEHALTKLSSDTVGVKVVYTGVGPVSESDVDLACATEASVLAFNTKPSSAACESYAKRSGVSILQHRVIYQLLDDVGRLLVGLAPEEMEEKVVGSAEVLKVFGRTATKKKGGNTAVAGCRVTDGQIRAGGTGVSFYRVMRGGEAVHQGSITSIRRHELDVEKVGAGTECGVLLDGWNAYEEGDVLQCVDMVARPLKEVKVTGGGIRVERRSSAPDEGYKAYSTKAQRSTLAKMGDPVGQGLSVEDRLEKVWQKSRNSPFYAFSGGPDDSARGVPALPHFEEDELESSKSWYRFFFQKDGEDADDSVFYSHYDAYNEWEDDVTQEPTLTRRFFAKSNQKGIGVHWTRFHSIDYQKLTDLEELAKVIAYLKPSSDNDLRPILVICQGLLKDIVGGRIGLTTAAMQQTRGDLEEIAARRAREATQELHDKAERLTTELEESRRSEAALRDENESLLAELARLREELAAAAAERDEERAARQAAEALVHEYGSKIGAVDDVVAGKDDLITRLEQEIEALKKAMADMEARHAEELEEWKGKLADETARAEGIEAERKKLAAEARSLRADLKLQAADLKDIQQRYSDAKNKAAKSLMKMAMRDTVSGDQSIELNQMQRRVQELEEELAGIRDMEQRLKECKDEGAEMSLKMRDLEEELRMALKELEGLRAAQTRTAGEAGAELERVQAENLDLMRRISELEKLLDAEKRASEGLREEVTKMEEKIKTMEFEVERQNAVLDGLRAKARRCQELEMKLNELHEQHARMESEMGGWDQRAGAKEAEHAKRIAELEAELARLLAERKRLEGIIEQKDAELDEAREVLQRANHEIDGLKAVLETSEKEADRLKAMQAQSSDEIKHEYLKIQDELRDAKKKLADMAALNNANSKLEEDLAALKAKLAELRALLAAAEDAAETAKREARDAAYASNAAKEELDAMRETADRLRRVHADSGSNVRDQVLALEEELARMRDDLRMAKADAANNRHGGMSAEEQEELERLRAHARALEQQLAAAQRAADGREAELEAARLAAEQAASEIEGLKAASEAASGAGTLTPEDAAELARLRAEAERLSRDLEKRELEISGMKEAHRRTESMLKRSLEDAGAQSAQASELEAMRAELERLRASGGDRCSHCPHCNPPRTEAPPASPGKGSPGKDPPRTPGTPRTAKPPPMSSVPEASEPEPPPQLDVPKAPMLKHLRQSTLSASGRHAPEGADDDEKYMDLWKLIFGDVPTRGISSYDEVYKWGDRIATRMNAHLDGLAVYMATLEPPAPEDDEEGDEKKEGEEGDESEDDFVLTYTSADETSHFLKGKRLIKGSGVGHGVAERQEALDIDDVSAPDAPSLFWWRDQDNGHVAQRGKLTACKTRMRRTGAVIARPTALPRSGEKMGVVICDSINRDAKEIAANERKLSTYAAEAMGGLFQQAYDAQQKAYEAAMRAKKLWGGALGKVKQDVHDKHNVFGGLMEDLQAARRLRAKLEKQLCTPQRLKELYELKRYVAPVPAVVYLVGSAMELVYPGLDALRSFAVPMHKEMCKMLWKGLKKHIVVGGRDIKLTLLGKLGGYRPEVLQPDAREMHGALVRRVLEEVTELDAKKICPCAVLLREWLDIVRQIMDHTTMLQSPPPPGQDPLGRNKMEAPEMLGDPNAPMSNETEAIVKRAEAAKKVMAKLGYVASAAKHFKNALDHLPKAKAGADPPPAGRDVQDALARRPQVGYHAGAPPHPGGGGHHPSGHPPRPMHGHGSQPSSRQPTPPSRRSTPPSRQQTPPSRQPTPPGGMHGIRGGRAGASGGPMQSSSPFGGKRRGGRSRLY